MVYLQELRVQIDDIDRMLIASLSSSGEDIPCPISELKKDEIIALQNTGLIFSKMTWQLLVQRLEVVKNIGKAKLTLGITTILDKVRKEQVLESRVKWASKKFKESSVKELYKIIHDISVRLQEDA